MDSFAVAFVLYPLALLNRPTKAVQGLTADGLLIIAACRMNRPLSCRSLNLSRLSLLCACNMTNRPAWAFPRTTLLYPFHAASRAEKEIGNLVEFFSATPAFEFSLTEVRQFPRTAYLHPDVPQRFTEIIRKLSDKWPDCRPYRGAFQDIIPHLTVADQVDVQVLHLVRDRLLHQLPIVCLAKEAWLLCSNENGLWSRTRCFPLAASSCRLNSPRND